MAERQFRKRSNQNICTRIGNKTDRLYSMNGSSVKGNLAANILYLCYENFDGLPRQHLP